MMQGRFENEGKLVFEIELIDAERSRPQTKPKSLDSDRRTLIKSIRY